MSEIITDSELNRKGRRRLAGHIGIPRSSKLVYWKTVSQVIVDKSGKEHNSHSHTFGFYTGYSTHRHSWRSTTHYCYDSTSHYHVGNYTSYDDNHRHYVSGTTSVESAVDLGHVHTISVTTGSGGGSHSHDIEDRSTDYSCGSMCLPYHDHALTGSINAADGSHTHAFSTTTGAGSGTLQAHTHPVSDNVDEGDSPTHSSSINCEDATCALSYEHSHGVATIYAGHHVHSLSGNTDSDGESPPDPPANVDATDGDHPDKVVITWDKSDGATGYKVYEGSNLLDTLGDVATYDDTAAPAPTITPGTAAASDGTSAAHVALSLSGHSASDGASRTYKVVAFNAAGDSGDSNTDTGYRGTTTLTYQWQRSAADSDADYSNITGGTTNPYDDTEAPPANRYYRCVVSMTGATPQTSSPDRGFRGVIGPFPTHFVVK